MFGNAMVGCELLVKGLEVTIPVSCDPLYCANEYYDFVLCIAFTKQINIILVLCSIWHNSLVYKNIFQVFTFSKYHSRFWLALKNTKAAITHQTVDK